LACLKILCASKKRVDEPTPIQDGDVTIAIAIQNNLNQLSSEILIKESQL
jgi:hypothetical protein